VNDSLEKTFSGNEFCQWLITNDYVENELLAETYFQQLRNNKQIICINQTQNEEDSDLLSNWYAFSK
jgi:hypothetical protein